MVKPDAMPRREPAGPQLPAESGCCDAVPGDDDRGPGLAVDGKWPRLAAGPATTFAALWPMFSDFRSQGPEFTRDW